MAKRRVFTSPPSEDGAEAMALLRECTALLKELHYLVIAAADSGFEGFDEADDKIREALDLSSTLLRREKWRRWVV